MALLTRTGHPLPKGTCCHCTLLIKAWPEAICWTKRPGVYCGLIIWLTKQVLRLKTVPVFASCVCSSNCSGKNKTHNTIHTLIKLTPVCNLASGYNNNRHSKTYQSSRMEHFHCFFRPTALGVVHWPHSFLQEQRTHTWDGQSLGRVIPTTS